MSSALRFIRLTKFIWFGRNRALRFVRKAHEMPPVKLLSCLCSTLLLSFALLLSSCGGGNSSTVTPPIVNPPGADSTAIFFASSVGGGISGISAKSGRLVELPASRILLSSGLRGMAVDRSGTFLVGTSSSLVTPTPSAQIVNIAPGGALTPGPTFPITGNAEGMPFTTTGSRSLTWTTPSSVSTSSAAAV